MKFALRCLLWIGFALFAAGAVPGAASTMEKSDQLFLDAREAFRQGDARKLDRAAAQLRDHALYPYVELFQLLMRIDELGSDAVSAYRERNAGALTSEKLLAEWVRTLGKKQEWARFGDAYAALLHDDPELTCYGLQYRLRSDPEALGEARRLWFTGQDLPEACNPLFASLFSAGRLGSSEIRARQRFALDAGNLALARKLESQIPPPDRIAGKRLEQALRNPEKLLAKADFKWNQGAERALAVLALMRVARSSPTAAHEFWLRHAQHLPMLEARAALGYIAAQGARRLQPEALEWFDGAEGAALTDEAIAWKARLALRFGHWATLLASIDAMPQELAQEGVWRYWKGRALSELGRRETARALWQPLAKEYSYYGLLAAEELGQAVELKSQPVQASAEALAALERTPAVQRMLKFYDLGMRYEGTREWIWAIRGMSDDELLVAAEFARRKGLFDRAINTAEKTIARHDFNLRFMAPYREHLSSAAREHGLDEALVFALVRQESRFLPEARSRAGAVGLMQLMPPTAKWVARKTGNHGYRPSQIGIVDVNVKFGAYYLRYVLDRLGGLPVLAAAAYNAGPGRALNWRGPMALEGAAYVESIPFTETRDYVKKVLANAMFYAEQLKLAQVSLKTRLGTIPPRDASLAGVYAVPERSELAEPAHERQ